MVPHDHSICPGSIHWQHVTPCTSQYTSSFCPIHTCPPKCPSPNHSKPLSATPFYCILGLPLPLAIFTCQHLHPLSQSSLILSICPNHFITPWSALSIALSLLSQLSYTNIPYAINLPHTTYCPWAFHFQLNLPLPLFRVHSPSLISILTEKCI